MVAAMGELKWKTPEINDIEWIKNITEDSRCMGSDTSYVNIFLLRNKYDIEISFYKSFLLRRYNGKTGRKGYGYPIGNGDIKEALKMLEKDAQKRGEKLMFCLLDEHQKEKIEKEYLGDMTFESYAGNSDYIYNQQELALLKGNKYHKKKNHVSRFERKFSDFRLEIMDDINKQDAVKVAQMWYKERMDKSAMLKSAEYMAITESVECFDKLGLTGAILYVNENPVAMTMASSINGKVCDIHFEKAIGGYADNGAYAAINQKFARCLDEYDYINREEDIGIEGLRKAKMSYHPAVLLKKYTGIRK